MFRTLKLAVSQILSSVLHCTYFAPFDSAYKIHKVCKRIQAKDIGWVFGTMKDKLVSKNEAPRISLKANCWVRPKGVARVIVVVLVA